MCGVVRGVVWCGWVCVVGCVWLCGVVWCCVGGMGGGGRVSLRVLFIRSIDKIIER